MFWRRAQRREAVAAVAGSYEGGRERSLQHVARTVAQARSCGARLVVFPEAVLGGYPSSGIPPLGLCRDGPHVPCLREIAGPTVVCIGYTEARPAGGVYSSAVCVSGDGVLGHHRKVHIPPSEQGVFHAGEGFAAFDTPVGRLGMLLCYDKMFPEAARALSLGGAGIIASMAAWPVSRETPSRWLSRDRQVRHFNLLDETRALENQVVWVSANLCGKVGTLRFPGHAKVVDPGGRVLASTHGRPGIALARLDVPATVSTARRVISHLEDRRPDAYATRPGAVATVL